MEGNENTKLVHPGIKDSRVLMYLGYDDTPAYQNTEKESALLQLWHTKYTIAKAEYEKSRCNGANVKIWRDAYEGKFKVLDKTGKPTDKYQKAVRKLAFELVEGKVNSHIPAPKMSPRYHSDTVPVNATEALIRHEMDRMLSEDVNDQAEHAVLIDGFTWFKVSWNPFDNTHERSGNPVVECCPVDTVFPQPGIKDYRRLEYIFEERYCTISEIYDLYGRKVPVDGDSDLVLVVNCYFLNKDRYVGRFVWAENSQIVLGNDLEWGIRKRRECSECHKVVPILDTCPVCGSTHFKYYPVKEQTLKNELVYVTNPYRAGETQDVKQDVDQLDAKKSIPANTVIPHYLVRQLPFVPYRRITAPNSTYGMSEVEVILEDEDFINKLLNKTEVKSGKSKTWITKLKDTHITDDGEEVAFVEVESPQEGQSIQVKQIVADISEEMAMAQTVYEIAKSTVGVTDTDQGKADATARSGKAKQIQMAASAARNTAPSTLRNLAYSGVYELIFKYLLAFSDEERSFVNLLPDGTTKEEVWSKYMFLEQDEDGEYYYRDDFAWSVDTATEITQDRAAMWQLIDQDFINGTLGTQINPQRALLMYWNMKEQAGYPLAKFALAFLKESQQHLPDEIEQALVNNPQAVQMALSYIADMQRAQGLSGSGSGQQGGARLNSGPKSEGATKAATTEKTNNRNRAQSGNAETTQQATSQGGMQGGTGAPNIAGGESL